MAREFAAAFYSSPQWKQVRQSYKKSVGGLCERCLRSGVYNPGVIVHHRQPLTPENINNAETTMGFGNLELLCRQCHEAMHSTRGERRYTVADDGRVIL